MKPILRPTTLFIATLGTITLLFNNCSSEFKAGTKHEGTFSGGGGFGDESSMLILGLAQKELSKKIQNASPRIFSQLPSGWDQQKLVRVIENVRLEPNQRAFRNQRELIFNYDTRSEEVIATELFFRSHSAVPVNQLIPLAIYDYVAEVELKLLHELSHLMGIGLSESLDAKSREFAKGFLQALDEDLLVCETHEASLHDSKGWSYWHGALSASSDSSGGNPATAPELLIYPHPVFRWAYDQLGIDDPLADAMGWEPSDLPEALLQAPPVKMKFLIQRTTGFAHILKSNLELHEQMGPFEDWDYQNSLEAYADFAPHKNYKDNDWSVFTPDRFQAMFSSNGDFGFVLVGFQSLIDVFSGIDFCPDIRSDDFDTDTDFTFCRSRRDEYVNYTESADSWVQVFKTSRLNNQILLEADIAERPLGMRQRVANATGYPVDYPPEFLPAGYRRLPGVNAEVEFSLKFDDKIRIDLGGGTNHSGIYSIRQTYNVSSLKYTNQSQPDRDQTLNVSQPVVLSHDAPLTCVEASSVIAIPQ